MTFRTIDTIFVFQHVLGSRSVGFSMESSTRVPLSPQCEAFVMRDGVDTVRAEIDGGRGEVALDELLAASQGSGQPRARFCGRAWTLTLDDIRAFARLGQLAQQTQTADPNLRSESELDPGAIVRARLDAEHDVIMACARTREPLAVEATWTEGGVVALSAGDDPAVDQCIATAVGEIEVQVDAPGRLLHVVRSAE